MTKRQKSLSAKFFCGVWIFAMAHAEAKEMKISSTDEVRFVNRLHGADPGRLWYFDFPSS